MIRFDNDHHGTLDAGVGAVHPITVIPIFCGISAMWRQFNKWVASPLLSVLILLWRKDGANVDDNEGQFSVALKTARREIERLKVAGRIRLVEAQKTGSYEIIDKCAMKERHRHEELWPA